MDGWTVIPRWLYENDLSDLELQTVYVRQAEQKWQECAQATEALEDEVRALEQHFKRPLTAERWAEARDELGDLAERLRVARSVEAAAMQFLVDARLALRKYQPPESAPRKRIGPPRRRVLPRPRSPRGPLDG